MQFRPLFLIASLACSLMAAEVEEPDGFWPLPRPSWMLEATWTPTLTASSVEPGMPARAVGLRPGATIVSTGGMFTASNEEFYLAVRIAAARADNRGTVIRSAGKAEDLRMPAFTAWGRWGVDFTEQAPEMPAGLNQSRQQAWRALPLRVRLNIQAPLTQGGPGAWLDNLLDLRLAADGTVPPPAILPMPGAYLQRVADWWRSSSAAGGRPAPTEDAMEALFRALHANWPIDQAPAAGKPATGDAESDRLFAAMAGDTPPAVSVLQAAASRLVNNGVPTTDPNVGSYLGQCLAAILDGDNHGGWPFRSALIYEKPARAAMVQALAALKDDPTLGQTVAFARIGPAVIDGDKAVLLDCLERLNTGSPWLAQRGLQTACHAASMWKRDQFVLNSLAAVNSPMLTPGLQARLRLMKTSPGFDVDVLFDPSPSALTLLPLMWSHHASWRLSRRAGRETGMAINAMLWDMATDPAGLDAEHVLPVARQLVLANAEGVPAYQADTVAAAMARAGRMADAVSWQQAAISMQRQIWMDEEQKAKLLREYEERLASFRRGEPVLEGEHLDGVSTKTQRADGSIAAGLIINGKQAGLWKTTIANGTVTEEIGYLAGKPCGIWLNRAVDGSLRWSGWVNRGSRLGWWRIRTADGGLAAGWFDGKNGGSRCGIWRLYDKDGRLRSEGPCADGRAIRPWSAIDAAGAATPIDPASIVLPDSPPLPAGATTVDAPQGQPVEPQPQRPSDF